MTTTGAITAETTTTTTTTTTITNRTAEGFNNNDLQIPLLSQEEEDQQEDQNYHNDDDDDLEETNNDNDDDNSDDDLVRRRRRRLRSCQWYYYLHCTLLPDQLLSTSTSTSASTQPQQQDSFVEGSITSGNNEIGNDDDDDDNNGDNDDVDNNRNNNEATITSSTTNDNNTDNMIVDDPDFDNDDNDDDKNEMISTMIKLMKFLSITFIGIFGLHCIVSFREKHRDVYIKAWHIWVFQTNLIVRDCIAFFVIGRLYQRRGIDHLAWTIPMIICNFYFECQHYVPFLRYSTTLYEIHCQWPWQLWIFIAVVILPIVGTIIILHIRYSIKHRQLGIKFMEILISVSLFVVPSIISYPKYFHFHHWFAGWLIGMHCNYDTWWSTFTMAWCWGMYINGIAVYGRDPILTCRYAEFLIHDLRCPFAISTTTTMAMTTTMTTTTMTCDNDNVDLSLVPDPFSWSTIVTADEGWNSNSNSSTATTTGTSLLYNDKVIWEGLISPLYDMPPTPVDWRNCSSKGYHP